MIQRVASRACAGHGGVIGYSPRDRLATDGARFAHRLLALGGIDDQRHLVILYHIDYVRATLADLIHPPTGYAGLFEYFRSTPGGCDLKAARDQHLREDHRARLIAI